MSCRVCGSADIVTAGTMRTWGDTEVPLTDCRSCGSRFAPHDPATYEKLHGSDQSTYASHDALAAAAARDIAAGDLDGLRARLTRHASRRAVFDAVAARPRASRILEVGASRGALSSWFIASGYDAHGVDIAPSAVEAACDRFGPHFSTTPVDALPDGSFDVVFHTGVVGCVADPLGFLAEQIRLLRPGGLLVFNAPDARWCHATGLAWTLDTPPPDLVTLFGDRVFDRLASPRLSVATTRLAGPATRDLRLTAQRLAGQLRLPDRGASMLEARPASTAEAPRRSATSVRGRARAIATRLLEVDAVRTLVPVVPLPYGLIVTIRRDDDASRPSHE